MNARSLRCWLAGLAIGLAVSLACADPLPDAALDASSVHHVDWSRSANIYEVNVRQFTPEGTLAAFAKQLPRLRAMGVDIVWIMPVQPIGALHRKGTLGSYYAVRDYRAVNPEFGTFRDFKRVVHAAHALGMKVILDWVANHTAWDHPWIVQHPQWYQRDANGRIHSYEYVNGTSRESWTDVVGLDYRNPALWPAMIDSMRFWIREADLDGFRCDVAGRVPTPFWERARAELETIKPVFMLAEADDPGLHYAAFDMTYNWDLLKLMRGLAKGDNTPADLAAFAMHPPHTFPRDAYRMNFTSNHDINSWGGSDAELYGEGFRAFAVLAATWPGMALVYGGQEAGLNKRLEFFTKDPIVWTAHEHESFYSDLLRLKKQNPALWNGVAGGAMDVLPTGNASVFAFERKRGDNAVRIVINFSAGAQTIDEPGIGNLTLAPWSYRVAAGSPALHEVEFGR